MPWIVAKDFRHLSQAAHSFLQRARTSPFSVIARTSHSARAVLWPPAVAFKSSHSHAPTAASANAVPEEVGRPHVTDRSLWAVLRWDRSREGVDGSELVPVTPPPEILSVLDKLFVQHPRRCTRFDLLPYQPTADLTVYLRHARAVGIALYFLETRDAVRAFWVLRLSTDLGLTLSGKLWPRLIEKFAKLGKWEIVLRLINVAVKTTGSTTTALLNWRLQAFMETQRYITLEEALAMFEEGDVRASKLTYHLLVSMHLRNSDLTGAISSMRAMESAGFPVTVRTCAVVLLSYRSLGFVSQIQEEAIAALNTADNKVSDAILNGLIQLLLDAEDLPGVVDILSSVSRPPGDVPSGPGAGTIRPDDALLGVLKSAAGSRASLSVPRKQLVDITTYNILLHHFARQGDLPQALHVLQHLRSAQVHPNNATAAALVRLYFSAGCSNDALHILSGILAGYPSAVALLPRLGFVKDDAPEHPIPPPVLPSVHIFNALLRGILPVHGSNGLHIVLSIMRIAGVDANAMTCTILLSYALRRRGPRYRDVIRTVRSLMSSGVKPTLQHLHALLDSLLRDERAAAYPPGWELPPHSTSNVDAPSSSADNPGQPSSTPSSRSVRQPGTGTPEPFLPLSGFTLPRHRKYGNLLRPVFQSLSVRQVRADRATFAMHIKHDALVKHDVKAAQQTFRTMLKRGIQPNRYHYGALMEGHAAQGNLQAATDIMADAVEAGVQPDVKTHTILIAGYARLGQAAKAVDAFRRMVAEGIRPDVPAIDALVSAFYRARAYGRARRVLLELWSQVAPFPEELADASLKELAVAFRALHSPSARLPVRLSVTEQRTLRRTTRRMLQTWTGVLGQKRGRGRGVSGVCKDS